MNPIVRRASAQTAIQESSEQLPARTHRTENITVRSQLTLGVEPRLSLGWRVEPSCWRSGFTLLVFQSRTGFCPDKYPQDLNHHGQLIIETCEDGIIEQVPEEGTHFFTFLLHKKLFLGLSESMQNVRFSETVPSAKVAIGRIRDRLELEEMLQRNEIGKIEHQAKMNEANLRLSRSKRSLELDHNPPPPPKVQNPNDALIDEEMAGIDAMIAAMFARNRKTADFMKSREYQELSPEERQIVLDRIAEKFDPGEISARREMRNTK